MMKLIYAPTSPYARKTRVCVRELGLTGQVREIELSPFGATQDQVRAFNPLGKVPALAVSAQRVLFDSRVIVEYLDAQSNGHSLFPPRHSPEYWEAVRLQSLADGILDAAVSIAFERRRCEAIRSADWICRWTSAIQRGLDALDRSAGLTGTGAETVTIGQIAAATVPDYLDLRVADRIDWRANHPRLAAWHSSFSERASLRETQPPMGS